MPSLEAEGTTAPIVQYWHAEEPPERIAAGLASFSEHNPDLPHRVFDHGQAEAFIAENLTAREVSAFRACAVPSMQSDYFRYCAILSLGGVYCDADFRCGASLRPLIEKRDGTLFARESLPDPVAKAANLPYWVGPYPDVDASPLAFREPGHPLVELVVTIATANIENRIAEGPLGVWLTAGPGVLTCMYLLDRLGSLEAFRRYLAGTLLEPAGPLFCEVVGSHATVARAMEGVAIQPRDSRANWVRPLVRPQPGEQPHWGNFEGTIFNDARPVDRKARKPSAEPQGPTDVAVLHPMPVGSETAIVAFSAQRTRPDGFNFFHLGHLLPNTSKLLVRDPSDGWYNAGLPEVGETVEEIAARLQAELAAMGAKRVITIGASMGGYGAILFGCLIGAERTIALAPQTLLDRKLALRVPPPGAPLQVPDLLPIMREAPQTAVDLVVPLEDLIDVFHAERVTSLPSVRRLGLPGAFHSFPIAMYDRGQYWPFVIALLKGEVPDRCVVEPPFRSGLDELLYNGIVTWMRGEREAAATAAARLAQEYPEWPAAREALAAGLAT